MNRKKKTYSDPQILDQLKGSRVQQERMINWLYQQYLGLIYRGMEKYQLSREEAAEAYADAIIGLRESVVKGKFEGRSKVFTFLFQIFEHKCGDKLRRKTTHKASIKWIYEIPNLPMEAKSFLQKLILEEEVTHLKELIFELGEKCRQLLWDTEYWGYDLETVAQKLGLKNARSASSQKYKCMERLKKQIKKSQSSHKQAHG
ncbi:MAG: sigma-70 family RNA polymerase sigma factor [Bacteroidota bacterium]